MRRFLALVWGVMVSGVMVSGVLVSGVLVKGTGDPAVSPHDVPAANLLLTMGGE